MSSDEQEKLISSQGSVLAMRRPKRSHIDDFVSSMTFATNGGSTFKGYGIDNPCDCGDDECEATLRGVPTEIAEAVRNYKLLRKDHPYVPSISNSHDDAGRHLFAIPLNFHPNKPRQERLLLVSSSNVRIWKLTLPTDAEPLIESGGTHRLVYVRHLPRSSSIISIGRGIYGSSMEEKERVRMKWTKGGWYLLPSNGGISLGWIHKHCETSPYDEGNTENCNAPDSSPVDTNDAVVIVIKLSPHVTTKEEKEKAVEKQTCLTKPFFNILKTYLTKAKTERHMSKSLCNFEEELGRKGGIEISNQDHAQLLQQALRSFLPLSNDIL